MSADVAVVHYGEIGIKGRNREFFERKLIDNIRRVTGGRVRRRYGRIVVELDEVRSVERIAKVPGVKYIGIGVKTDLDMEKIKEAAFNVVSKREFNTFRVDASRSNKSFPMNSVEINREVGAYIVEKTGKRVNLKNPDVTIWIEVCEKEAYIYADRIEGVGGLPVGSAGRVVALISGGIDSPVACFMAMKRGCEVVAVHFFNRTIHSPEVRKKIIVLTEKLSEYHGRMRLYMIPFQDVQVEIIKNVPPKLRMIVYRRSMMRMACAVAEKEEAKAIVTGDSLSQVASQTLDNLNVIFSASRLVVLPPLIGMDKEEIVAIAKKIGTYDISILPYEDCCTFMIARHPETRAKLSEVEGYEFPDAEASALGKAEVLEIEPKVWRRR